jgi:hypothetical protein
MLAASNALQHPISDVVLLLVDTLTNYGFSMLQFFLVVFKDALNVVLRL